MTLLDVREVSVSFGGLRAVEHVSLHVDNGAVVGLIGPNGAGKTTLFNVISGLQPAETGRVLFGDHDISALPAHRRARLGIGRSFQNLGLMSEETVRTNLMAAQYLGAGYRGWDVLVRPRRWWDRERNLTDKAVAALSRFGLEGHLDALVADLSFGAARFVEVAAVLAEEPALMLLDEPTTGLDVAEVARLREVLVRVNKEGTTILLIAHDVRFVMGLCDHVYVLAEGRLLAEGPPQQVQRDPHVIEAYLGKSA